MPTHYTTCNICEATCGLAVHVDGHRVTHIEPDTEHVASHGYACVKGLKIHEVHHSPDRRVVDHLTQHQQCRTGPHHESDHVHQPCTTDLRDQLP